MARQLAALPKKQFEMYRAKPKTLVAREILTLPTTTINISNKFGINGIHTTSTDFKLNDTFLNMTLQSNEDTIETVTPPSNPSTSAKKKAKKKKKKSSTASDQASNVENANSSVIIENKLLDSGESGSRIVTMNKSMVADISVVKPEEKSYKKQSIEENIVDTTENGVEQLDSETTDSPEELRQLSSPPFGHPLSTDKLIQSAIELLSCEPSNDIYKIDNSASNKEPSKTDPQDISRSSNVSMDSSVDGPLVDKDNLKDNSRSPDPIDLKVDESVDGDISNLSAWDEDEGWQSQGRRSHRKRKKDFQSRERSNSGKKDIPKETKQNNRRQNPRGSHNRNFIAKPNDFSNGSKTLNLKAENDNVQKIEKCNKTTDNSTSISKTEKEEKNSSNNTGAVFSYRDALLKAKSKPTEELQYNSDSGVDVNSVGSCDSAIHSPKIADEFDLEEAVNYLMKGWNEVKELHKKGQVVYHRDVDNQPSASKKKNFRKPGWHGKPRHQTK
ncbi:hypothetical protein AC249_AIPGENE18793 [Exaiptasia diaphana]|nr:hypothetical protein AC249_AIPGENE18793 [Exaiptasia diaphana]